MLTCLYKGKIINAIELPEDFQNIKMIRLAGSNGELICDECKSPVFFKQGKVIESHFAHFHDNGRECASMRESEIKRKCKRLLYQYFKSLYPSDQVTLEKKVIENHRSDLVIEASGKVLCIELLWHLMSARDVENLYERYASAHQAFLGIVIGKPSAELENKLSYAERKQLHETINHKILYLDAETEKFFVLRKYQYETLSQMLLTQHDPSELRFDLASGAFSVEDEAATQRVVEESLKKAYETEIAKNPWKKYIPVKPEEQYQALGTSHSRLTNRPISTSVIHYDGFYKLFLSALDGNDQALMDFIEKNPLPARSFLKTIRKEGSLRQRNYAEKLMNRL